MKKGFTLIEVCIVVAIIAILASVAIPTIKKYRERQAERKAKQEKPVEALPNKTPVFIKSQGSKLADRCFLQLINHVDKVTLIAVDEIQSISSCPKYDEWYCVYVKDGTYARIKNTPAQVVAQMKLCDDPNGDIEPREKDPYFGD